MTAYLSLGSNLGNREQTIEQALALIETYCGEIIRRSSPFYSAPMGFASQHEFCNICAAIHTSLTPTELLSTTQHIERELGRTSKSTIDDKGMPIHFDRTIDIDIVKCYDDEGYEMLINSPILTIPHPRYLERPFVTIPLNEINLD